MKIHFSPRLDLDCLILRDPDGSLGDAIPAWLLDRPDVLRALLILAERGGTDYVRRAPDDADISVDTGDKSALIA